MYTRMCTLRGGARREDNQASKGEGWRGVKTSLTLKMDTAAVPIAPVPSTPMVLERTS